MGNRYTGLLTIASIVARPKFAARSTLINLPRLLVFTDPKRSPDLLHLAANLPPGSGLVYRHFGAKDRFEIAGQLSHLCQVRKLIFLIGDDPALALAVGADGVHLPERALGALPRIRARYGFSLISTAAHSVRAARAGLAAGANWVVLSSVFASTSPSAGKPLGLCRFGLAHQKVAGPVMALGGITRINVARLQGLSQGIALVSAANADKADSRT